MKPPATTNPEREAELAAMVEEHRVQLQSVIRSRLRDQIEAEDVYQEVFLEFMRAYDLGTAIETLGAWLVRVAQNKILDRFRRKKTRDDHRNAVLSAEGESEPSSGERPDEEWTRSWLREELVEALQMLPPDQLDVFVKHELEGKSFEEIAAESGVNVNTLLSRKRYAVKFLRDYLKEVYDELE